MKPEQVESRVWELVYEAKINQRYYQTLSTRWRRADVAVSVALIMLSLASAILGAFAFSAKSPTAPTAIWAYVATALSTIVACLLAASSINGVTKYNSELYAMWTSFLERSEKFSARLESMDRKEIGPDMDWAYNELIAERASIEKAENRGVNETLHKKCQKEINRQTYHVENGTYEEVMQKLEAAKPLAG